LEGLLRSYFPKAVLEEQSWKEFPETCTAHDSYVMGGPHHLIRTFADFNPDPYAAFCAGMETTLQPGEFVLVSFRFGRVPEAMLIPNTPTDATVKMKHDLRNRRRATEEKRQPSMGRSDRNIHCSRA
jgi:hypothetical protein